MDKISFRRLPCRECITLSICKGIFADNVLVYDYYIARRTLQERCSLLNEYMDKLGAIPIDEYSEVEIVTKCNELYNYMGDESG